MEEINQITEDKQYLSMRNCTNATLNIKVTREIGILSDPFDCNSDIVWFNETSDFKIDTYDPDELSISHEDIDSNFALKQSQASDGSLEWTKTLDLNAEYGSRFLQYIVNFMSNESSSGRDGKGIIAAANGAFWFKETIIANEGQTDEFTFATVYGNLKVGTWPVPFSGNIKADTVYSIDFMVQDFPKYFYDGVVPEGWATPSGLAPVAITYDAPVLTDTELTFPLIALVDTDVLINIDITNPVYIQVADELTGDILIDGSFLGDGTDAVLTFDFSSFDNVSAMVSYQREELEYVPYKVEKISKIVAP